MYAPLRTNFDFVFKYKIVFKFWSDLSPSNFSDYMTTRSSSSSSSSCSPSNYIITRIKLGYCCCIQTWSVTCTQLPTERIWPACSALSVLVLGFSSWIPSLCKCVPLRQLFIYPMVAERVPIPLKEDIVETIVNSNYKIRVPLFSD